MQNSLDHSGAERSPTRRVDCNVVTVHRVRILRFSAKYEDMVESAMSERIS